MANSRKFFGSSETRALRTVAVIGLGRFGGALAVELESLGIEVLGIDAREDTVQSFNGILTHVVRADSTREEVLRQLGVHEFDVAIVGIGSDIEASILTASRLLKFNKPAIWAKAISEPHAEILGQLGVSHVVRPENDMGRRVAHLISGGIIDYIDLGQDFVLVRTRAPEFALHRPLSVLELRKTHGITITAIRPADGKWESATPQTIIEAEDEILVQGPRRNVESFRPSA
ncbi:potassium channel family protein [Neomicrococcus lactis]|uniref:Trk system potassium uptake protein TrkA n=1 Tax=Neomicrococcus lactis TaxID=732241 RepID=A0A7W8YCQ7_9MICC|nr:TrkA family potassium uptake protein [Neomicrococcus lactis]MBB5599109.1 trk system potassium uptake protein TrkA [Neomicrococcus lactis]